jgi:hypothetical protein
VASLLFGVLVFVYRTAVSAWSKGDKQTELRQNILVCTEKITRDLERSTYASVSASSDLRGLAFLSAQDVDSDFQFDAASQQPRWQKFLIYYLDTTDKTLRRREVSVVGTPLELSPDIIDTHAGQPVDDYLNGGQPVGQGIDTVEFTIEPSTVRVKFSATGSRIGSKVPEKFELETLAFPRN